MSKSPVGIFEVFVVHSSFIGPCHSYLSFDLERWHRRGYDRDLIRINSDDGGNGQFERRG